MEDTDSGSVSLEWNPGFCMSCQGVAGGWMLYIRLQSFPFPLSSTPPFSSLTFLILHHSRNALASEALLGFPVMQHLPRMLCPSQWHHLLWLRAFYGLGWSLPSKPFPG